jgi:hypothetical protein
MGLAVAWQASQFTVLALLLSWIIFADSASKVSVKYGAGLTTAPAPRDPPWHWPQTLSTLTAAF